ncbi:MAG: IS982 family transposase, partial [Prevotella sp.]|nr:IS982 family transposase [Prevotella sp.]
RLNQKNWTPPTWAYKRFRKRIETVFSQLNDHLMMIRNYAKKPSGLFARMAAKVAAFTMLQYFNLLNHRPIGQVKYALF